VWSVSGRPAGRAGGHLAAAQHGTLCVLCCVVLAALHLRTEPTRSPPARRPSVCESSPVAMHEPFNLLVVAKRLTENIYRFCCLAVLDPTVGHTMDVLSPFIPVLCHSD